VFNILADLATRPPTAAETARAREVLLADWAFGHERISQQGLTVAADLALLGQGWTEATLQEMAALGREDLFRAAANLLRPERGSVLGWSLPAAGADRGNGSGEEAR